ncbi:vWA domain-containing protein [Deinococcus yavapaiensis]|uniref:Putative metal-dependent peptidase n=1 Tax=Deinococcus yavapaiensis KR-236 TaxID=694435 RepID=A0A318S5M0_9DEIO|nr:VWA-like domain-containing protein [Deinococcus yavapaiensis]PYE49462.1 putative metal-dependent peptidase [Deinococcus yavapaiensis KR-236]
MTTPTIWTPIAPARAMDARVLRTLLERHVTVIDWRWDDDFDPADVIIAANTTRAGAPYARTRPLRVSSGAWTLAEPLRLAASEHVNALWWHYLATLARASVKLDLPRLASAWIADELRARDVNAWRDANLDAFALLERTASAAMIIVADGEVHAHGGFLDDDPSGHAAWADQGRVPLGRHGWRDALASVQSGRLTPQLIEPWGPMLDATGVFPDGAFEGVPSGIANTLRRLNRAVQGHPRAAQGGEGGEANVAWAHEHPDASHRFERTANTRRSTVTSRLAYQLGRAAREAAMSRAQERLEHHASHAREDAPSGLASAMQELSTALQPVLAGKRGDRDNEANERRVDAVLLAWSDVGQNIPHLRPTLAELQLELDPVRCLRARVSGVALDPTLKVVYVNLGAGFEHEQLTYAFAELALHLALGHPARGHDKQPNAWNYACDLLLAGWLERMGYGTRPDGAPYDATLSNLDSAEAIYLRLLDDPSLLRRRPSLRGASLPDLIGAGEDAARALTDEEDRAWRDAAARGMEEADALRWAGSMPAGLNRALRERGAEPIPWRPALQAYLSKVVPVRVRRRTYAHPSRRSSLNPNEPRAGRGRDEPGPRHSLVLVVDTSGSVGDRDLAEALGGVRTTCQVLGVDRVRVLSCDAGVTDHGWSAPWRAGDRLVLKGGGGTSLIPALMLTEQLEHEPDGIHPDTPMLIVTDGLFDDRLAPRREHAFLMPPGTRLLFATRAPVFTIRAT